MQALKRLIKAFSINTSLTPFVLGVMAIGLTSLALISNHQGFALRLINYSYLLISLGFIFYILESLEDEKD